jgi:hypothetical protein
MAKITIDGTEHDTDAMSEQSRNTLASIRFVDQQIQQKGHELNIAKTAQAAYAAAMKREAAKAGSASDNTTQGDN